MLETAEKTEPPSGPFYISPSVGIDLVSYQESFTGREVNYYGRELAARIGAIYRALPSRWDVGLAGSATIVTFGQNTTERMRFLGLNLRVGYHLPQFSEPWDISIQAGGYYTTCIVTNSAFGYRNLEAIQLYPTARRRLSDGSALKAYLKLAPVLSGKSINPLNNREIALGVRYVRPISAETEQSWSVGLDFSQLSLDAPQPTERFEVHQSTLSLNVGMAY